MKLWFGPFFILSDVIAVSLRDDEHDKSGVIKFVNV